MTTRPPEPTRSQSSTSLSRLYNGPARQGGGTMATEEELSDPRMDFCNSFWGQGDRGFEVVMARLRGAGRTVEELRAFWKERAAIEEDYAKRLNKLSRYSLGKDEVGDLADALQHLLNETAAQATYHSSLGNEIKQTVEQPTSELGVRLGNLKKGLQASIEKAYKNKGLQEQHVQKARERYEQDCLKLNSYTAQSSLTQGKELEKLHVKLDRVRQTIGANEQDFRQFVRVLEQTQAKWEGEWKGFCDHVQDLEEDRLALTKDLVWVYANAVSQVCVEDDSSCEKIREKLEQFEPQNDMLNFVRGWGTGDMIPDAPRFINYNAGESYPTQPAYHIARFQRISSRPPMPPPNAPTAEPETEADQLDMTPGDKQPNGQGAGVVDGIADGLQRTRLQDQPPMAQAPAPTKESAGTTKPPFGGVALPGMAAAPSAAAPVHEEPKSVSMPPPPVPPTMSMPEPRIPSRQSTHSPAPRNVTDEEDPMARALADLRREPPPPGSVRRNASHRRAESVVSASGSARGSQYGSVRSPASPAPNRMSYQQSMPPAQSRGSVDMTLSPPQAGHTAAALAKSMEEFRQQSSRGPDPNRQSVNYANYADDIIGAHPTSRPSTPSVTAQRAPSPAMMQAPVQPATHIADEVLSQYHQAFPGERSERARSRAGSVISSHSRAGSFVEQQQQQQQQPPPASPAREAFAGIGAGGGRSPSPQPPVFRSPSPSPAANQSSLGPQNLGISLDAKGGVAQDTMAEQYRRQYQQQQQQQQQSQQLHQPQSGTAQAMPSHNGRGTSQYGSSQGHQQYGGNQQQPQQHYPDQRSSMYGAPKSPVVASPGGMAPSISANRPVSGYGQPQQVQGGQTQYGASAQNYGQPPSAPQPAYGQYTAQQQAQGQPQAYQAYGQQPPQPNYNQHPSPTVQPYANGHAQQYGVGSQQQAYQSTPVNQYARSASPAPQAQQYGYRAPSPQPQVQAPSQQQQQQYGRMGQTPSPQPNQPPPNVAPTGQWAANGLPVLFYVKALYDYSAQSAAEFDFQANDIIAVTSTPEDGWWSGELLDEARRVPGRTDFPSNFVCLF